MDAAITWMRGGAVHVGCSEAVLHHRCLAYKLVVGVDAPVRVTQGGREQVGRAVLVSPDAPQAMAVDGIGVAAFLDPLQAQLLNRPHGVTVLTGAEARRLVDCAGTYLRDATPGGEVDFVQDAYRLCGPPRPRTLDRRVERALVQVQRAPDTPLSELAQRARLSVERLRHLITAQTGTPLRRHRVWQRTLLGVELLLQGGKVADVAHAAGFADHAHFTRCFVASFGRTPSSTPKDVRLLQSWALRA